MIHEESRTTFCTESYERTNAAAVNELNRSSWLWQDKNTKSRLYIFPENGL